MKAYAETGNSAVEMKGVGILSLRNQSATVLESVDWQVRVGDYWVLAGLQGSGKTDLLLTVGGVLPPARGSYHLFGQQMPIFDEARMRTRMRVGVVFEGGQLLNQLTVRDNISLPVRYHRNRSRADVHHETEKLMEVLEISPFAEMTPGGIGRNWQKRAGLARALALKPELLLIDGPLGGLDLRHTSWWLRFLDQLSRGETALGTPPVTLIVTSADLRPWQTHAHQFGILRDRRFVVLGNRPQLHASNRQIVAELLGEDRPSGDLRGGDPAENR